VRIASLSHSEGRVARIKNEKNDSESKKIHDGALVRLSAVDFGGHIAHRSEHRVQESAAVTSLYWSCEAEVGDLGVEILVK